MSVLTKLEAVNIVLKSIGETPISSLVSGLPDAEEAAATLEETMRDIEETGWHCNRDDNVKLLRETTGEIRLPNNCLKVDTVCDSADIDVVEREGKLYNRSTHSFVFDNDVYVSIVYLLAFEDLPYRLAYYIAWEAAGRYQMRTEGSDVLAGWIAAEIASAKAKLHEAEEEVDDANVLRDSESVRRLVYRNAYYG